MALFTRIVLLGAALLLVQSMTLRVANAEGGGRALLSTDYSYSCSSSEDCGKNYLLKNNKYSGSDVVILVCTAKTFNKNTCGVVNNSGKGFISSGYFSNKAYWYWAGTQASIKATKDDWERGNSCNKKSEGDYYTATLTRNKC